jgi:class 3 adenylate cyclase/tetratricopeptide (TPR) repeat protein
MIACAVCGYEAAEPFRFCPSCGQPSAPTGQEQRKVVTVLRCDVVGSTSLGETVDPEALRALLARYFERMKEIVESHGGTVEKFIGDAVLAVFGVPVAHEDDALRACRSALEMREALPELGVEGRLGLTTGEVVTGTEERLATGDPVNVAARLEQAAAPGEILIGEPTLALVRSAVEVEALPPLSLKGKAEPVPAFRLLAVHEPHERAFESRFVGRRRELATIRAAWERTLAERRWELITIVGEAGVGKSRLVAEAIGSLEARVVYGRCLPYGDGITYWPVVAVIKQLDALPADPVAADAIRSLLGESEAATSAEEIGWAFRKLLEEAAPLVVVFDDIQWGEETFLDLLEYVSLLSSGSPILILCMARPELIERRPTWPAAFRLEPLPSGEIEQLISKELPAGLRKRIAKAAGGNPLFVSEMLAMAGEVSGEVTVPPTLRALLAARLDQLEPPERRVLERGAVEGELFHRGAVQALAPEEPQVTPRLAALVRKEVIRPDKPQVRGEDGFRFRHLLIRDATYDGLSKASRAELHERFAAWLEKHGDLAELDELVGYHLEQAFSYRVEVAQLDDGARVLADRAAERLRAAGKRAFARDDAHAAAGLLGRAAALLSPERRDPELMCDLGQARTEAGDLVGAEEALREAAARARERGDASGEALAGLRAAFLQTMKSSASVLDEQLLVAAQQAAETFEAHGETARLPEAWRAAAEAHAFLGNLAAAREAAEGAVKAAEAAGNEREQALALCELGIPLSMGPIPVDEMAAEAERILAWAIAHRRLRPQAFALIALAYAEAMRGNFKRAHVTIDPALALLREISPLWAAGFGAQIRGMVELLTGSTTAARVALEEGLHRLERMNETGFLSTTAAMLAHVALADGEDDRAEALATRARAASAADDVLSQMLWRTALAKVAARRGHAHEAESLAREAVTIGAGTDYIPIRADCLADLAEVLRLAGRADDAAAALDEALALYEQKGNVVMAERTRKARSVLAGQEAAASERANSRSIAQ